MSCLAVGVYCGLLVETAMRPEEGLRQQWSFINLSQGMLTVDQSKTKRARHIPLSDYALELLRMVPRIIGCPYVIARLETMDRLKDPRVPFHNALEATGLDWLTFRDFRHFRASQWVMDGVDFKTVQGLMVFGYSHNDEVCALRTQSCQPEHIEAQRKEAERLAQQFAVGDKQETLGTEFLRRFRQNA